MTDTPPETELQMDAMPDAGKKDPLQDPFKGKSASKQMAIGGAWAIAVRWSVRGIGFISTIILVRLLAPEDFGLIAMAMIAVGFLETIATMSGEKMAVMRMPNPEPAHYNSAWTFAVIKGGVVALMLWFAAPFMGEYFNDPRAQTLMQIFALRPLIVGFENPGTLDFMRNLDFSKDFKYFVSQKGIQFLITITAALVMRNYWALVIGNMAVSLVQLGVSYTMSSYRPRFELSKIKEILSFSIWMFVSGIGTMILTRLDQLLVGGSEDPDRTMTMGHYTVAQDLANIVAAESIQPANRALFVVYSKLGDKLDELEERFIEAQTAFAYACFAIGFGIFLVAEPLVAVFLGEAEWAPTAPLLQILTFVFAVRGFWSTPEAVLSSLSLVKYNAAVMWLEVVAFATGALFIVSYYPSIGVGDLALMMAGMRLYGALMMAGIPFLILRWKLKFSIREMAKSLVRPALAAIAMVVAVKTMEPLMPDNVFVQLFGRVAIGAVVFVGTGLAAWGILSRRDGPERSVFQILRSGFGTIGQTVNRLIPKKTDTGAQ